MLAQLLSLMVSVTPVGPQATAAQWRFRLALSKVPVTEPAFKNSILVPQAPFYVP